VPLRPPDFAPFLTQIKNSNPPAVFSFFPGGDGVNFVKAWADFGLNKSIQLLSIGDLVDEFVLPAEGDAALGIITIAEWSLLSQKPVNLLFRKVYADKFNAEPSIFSVRGYDSANLIIQALQATAGDPQADLLVPVIEALKLSSPRGLLVFDPATHNVIQNVLVRQVKRVGDQLNNVVLTNLGQQRTPPFGCTLDNS